MGARRCTGLGKELARKIGNGIAKAGITIVSGLALGIDTIAHMSSIENKGKTIAVLAGGLHHIYPKENIKMIDQIIDYGGAVISEYQENEEPFRQRFPQRNRIIAAISNGVVVIEAGEHSGSLITAQFAKKFHKQLFVLPGSVCDENYEGSNQLLVEGAKCVRNADDVLKEYNQVSDEISKKRKLIKIPAKYKEIYTCLKTPCDANQIAQKLNQKVSEIQILLTMMEIEDWIKPVGRGAYVRRNV